MSWIRLAMSSSKGLNSLICGGDFLDLKPYVSFAVDSVLFRKWKAFHRIRRMKCSVFSINVFKYSFFFGSGMFLVE